MFNEINTEHIAVYAKVEPFIAEFRELTKTPTLLANLEKLVTRIPNSQAAMTEFRERAKAKLSTREKAAAAA